MTWRGRDGTLAVASTLGRERSAEAEHPRDTDGPRRRTIDMTDEHTKGTISKATGDVEEGLGKLTGNKEQELHGKAKQVQGAGQEALGDIQDVVQGSKDKDED
jgi:uncharacterized protein YjbJ (UPF0337 family)